MGLTREKIQEELKELKCPQGQCGSVAEEAINTLLEGLCERKNQYRCESLSEVLERIKLSLSETRGLVVVWANCGFADNGGPAWHTYIVFNADPLQSFSIWEKGLAFYNEEETRQKIEDTIASEKHDRVITIHNYGRIALPS